MKYNYRTAITEDVREYYGEEIKEMLIEKFDVDFITDEIEEEAFVDDAVTGNLSGSYTCNTYLAEEYLAHNLDLLHEAVNELGIYDVNELFGRGSEYLDVLIRVYLLNSCVRELVEELKEEMDLWYEENIYE